MANDPDQNSPNSADYNADSIKVLKGLDAVRKRPGMYIGDTDDGSGLHHMVFEVSDNAIDEALAGHCDRILIQLNPDGSVRVEDNGRGIPTGIHAEEGVSAAEVIMTQLHAGGKFENTSDDNAYKVSGGLHGVGVSVVNALREWLDLTIWRDGEEHYMRFAPRRCRSAAEGRRPRARGQEGHARHLPAQSRHVQDHRVRLRQARASLPRARLPQFGRAPDPRRCAARGARRASSCITRAGSRAFVKYLDRTKTPLFPEPIAISAVRDDIGIDVALEWNDSYYENVLSLHQQHPPARRRHAPGRVPRRADPHAQQLCREIGAC